MDERTCCSRLLYPSSLSSAFASSPLRLLLAPLFSLLLPLVNVRGSCYFRFIQLCLLIYAFIWFSLPPFCRSPGQVMPVTFDFVILALEFFIYLLVPSDRLRHAMEYTYVCMRRCDCLFNISLSVLCGWNESSLSRVAEMIDDPFGCYHDDKTDASARGRSTFHGRFLPLCILGLSH